MFAMVAEAETQPFALGADRRTAVFNDMHFYKLPWPKRALEELENEVVTVKVTLSYFIEPNLTGRAATRPEPYRSFGLRFANPVGGWWKSHPGQRRMADKGRYALVVSLSAPGLRSTFMRKS